MLLCFAVGLSCFANPINSLSWRCICGTQDAERKFVSQSSRPFHLLNHLIKNESKSETNQGSYDLELRQSIFSRVHATLQPALSVGWSVGRSHFTFFYDFISLTSLLLPKWSGDLKYGPCPPTRDFGSRVSGLVPLLSAIAFHSELNIFCTQLTSSFVQHIWSRSIKGWPVSWLKIEGRVVQSLPPAFKKPEDFCFILMKLHYFFEHPSWQFQ